MEFEQETTYKDGIFYLDEAKLIFNNGKFKLLQGSKFNKPTKMVADKDGKIYDSYIKFLNDNNESIIFSDNKCILKNDLEISSSSFAGALVKNRISCNGWVTWKNSKNKSLDDVYRKKE